MAPTCQIHYIHAVRDNLRQVNYSSLAEVGAAMASERPTNAKITSKSSIPYFVAETRLATRRKQTAIEANTIMVMTTPSTPGPLLSFKEGIAVLHNWAAKLRVSANKMSEFCASSHLTTQASGRNL